MSFEKIEAEKLSDAVIRQIETLILQGILRPAERLPSERDMAARMGVSRPSLREALHQLQAEGLLISRPGSGIYVAELMGPGFSPALIRLIARHPRASADYLGFRRDLEGLAAERAAGLASEDDLKRIDHLYKRMHHQHGKTSPEAEADLDAGFHMAIVEASHNVVALHMMRAMQDLLQAGVYASRDRMFADRTTRKQVLEQHGAINAALQARDGGEARRQIETHLDFVARQLARQQLADEQASIARLRLHHTRQEDGLA